MARKTTYKHKKGRCNKDCPFYTVGHSVNHTLRDKCGLTDRGVEDEKSPCNPYRSDRSKKKAAKEVHCPRCGMTKGELAKWLKEKEDEETEDGF